MKSIKNSALFVIFIMVFSIYCGDDHSKLTSNWQFLGRGISDGEISSLAIDTDSSGNPIVAYRDDANGGKLTVQKYVNSEWALLGTKGFTDSTVSYVCLDVYGDTPYVAFSDDYVSGKVSVMKFNGSSWEFAGTQGFSASGVYASSSYKSDRLSLSVLNNTEMYIAYISTTSEDGPYVYKYSGGNWFDITGAPASSSLTYEVSIFSENSTSIYLAYISNHILNLTKYNGTNWTGIGTAITGARDISLKANRGIPYIAYSGINGEFDTGGDNNSEPDRALVVRYDNSAWEQTGDIISENTATEITLAFCSDNTPYATFMDWNGVGAPSVYKFDSSSWIALGKSIIGVGTHYVTMAVYNAKPVVAFKENEGEYQGNLSVMRYK